MNCNNVIRSLALAALFAWAGAATGAGVSQPGIGPTASRYATDAYPGFDMDDKALKPEKKVPRWFSWINGPKMTTASEQLAWARKLEAEESWSRARKAYDALVREWPASPEAPKAQRAMADVLLNHELDYEEAFAAYRYLLDFYSSQCDYGQIAALMFQVANLMRQEGKVVVFFRFKNSTDVRRAFEEVVLRAPGAPFVPEAMLTIAEIRSEEQGDLPEAVAVLENLRNIHPDSPKAVTALSREADVRMRLLRAHGYNARRVADTVSFLRSALKRQLPEDVRQTLGTFLTEAEELASDAEWESAAFYDSRTRTKRSAISAYENFLERYPSSSHAEEARARLSELRSVSGTAVGAKSEEAK